MKEVTISLVKVECEKCNNQFYVVNVGFGCRFVICCSNCASRSIKKTNEELEIDAVKKLNSVQCEHCRQTTFSFYDKDRICCSCGGNSVIFMSCDPYRTALDNCINDTFKKWEQKSPTCKKSINIIRNSVRSDTFYPNLKDHALNTLWHFKEAIDY